MAQQVRMRTQILPCILVGISVVTFGAAMVMSYYLITLTLYFSSIGPGANWPSVITGVATYSVLGAAPLVAGLGLIFRDRKRRRG